jgi:hypothetical protein
VGENNFIDAGKLLNEAATSVPIDLLVERGKSKVKLVSRERLEMLINQAVMNILRKYRNLEGQVGAITQETKVEFAELMAEYKKSLEIQENLKKNRESMQGEIVELKNQLSARSVDEDDRVLQKRIEKLTEYAEGLENALRKLAEQKIYSNTQINTVLGDLGITPDDSRYEKKMKMFRIILDENKKIQNFKGE